MVDITTLLENTTVETILPLIDGKSELLKVNRGIFKDMIKGADLNEELKESEIDMYLRMLSDDDFISIIEPVFEKGQYNLIDPNTYSLLDETFVKMNKKVYLFIKESYLTRLLIATYFKYEWILKAMAIDYSKYVDQDLMDTYKEYFEGNNRVIESTLLEGRYKEGNNHWEIDVEHNTLIYSFGKKQVIWTKGEAEYRFEELMKS